MLSKDLIIKILTAVTYIVMITVNALANILPINGVTTGEISDSYPNLFAPAGVTFSIWGLIYLLLGIYILHQFTLTKISKEQINYFRTINIYFIITSIINSLWIFAWHYKLIGLTLILMIALLISLIKIADTINSAKLNQKQKLFTKIPFGVYFGWITIAAIANITVFLVSTNWNGFGVPDNIWMIFILLIGGLIGMWRTIKDSNIAYGLVPLWAYFGIWLKHTSAGGFNGIYNNIITTLLFCMTAFIFVYIFLILKKKFI